MAKAARASEFRSCHERKGNLTYLIRGHSVDVVNDEEDKEGSE